MTEHNWSIKSLPLPLKYDWSISRGATQFKQNFLIEMSSEHFSGRAEVAPNIRFAEEVDLVESQFAQMVGLGLKNCQSILEVKRVLSYPHFYKSLSFGVEASFLDWKSKSEGIPLESILDVPVTTSAPTVFSIPILDEHKLTDFYLENQLWKFKTLKLKVSKGTARHILDEFKRISNQELIIDANEAWETSDEFLAFSDSLDMPNILFFEQPLPAHLVKEYQKLKRQTTYKIVADESFVHNPNWNLIVDCFDGVNVKLMKVGSLLEAADMLRRARNMGLLTMLGCMIETSLGISYGVKLSSLADYLDLDGFLHLEKDPFGLLYLENGRINVSTSL